LYLFNWITSSIEGSFDLEWHYLSQFNWESKVTIVSITCNGIQLNNFLNWRIIWFGMTLSLSIQLRIKGSNCINYMEMDAIDGHHQFDKQLIWNHFYVIFNWNHLRIMKAFAWNGTQWVFKPNLTKSLWGCFIYFHNKLLIESLWVLVMRK